jgi:hypothetical protein
MIQPFQKDKSTSHHDQPDEGTIKHFRSERIWATDRLLRRMTVEQKVDGRDTDSPSGERLRDETRQSQNGREAASPPDRSIE